MQVACPSCSSEYNVPESHLPASGLKMRCPKCQARFKVHPDGRVDPPEGAGVGAVPKPVSFPKPGAAGKPSVPKPPRPSIPKPGGVAGADDADLPAPKKQPLAPSFGADEVDLPAPKAAAPKKPLAPPMPPAAPKKPLAPPLDDLDLDLPAPKAAAPRKQHEDLDLDLPAPVRRPSPPSPAAASKEQDFGDLDLDLDLPAQRGATPAPPREEADLPALRGGAAASEDFELDLPAPRGAPGGGAGGSPGAGALGGSGGLDDLDLPAPRGSGGGGALDDLDLPAPRGARGSVGGALDDLDLPAPRGAGAVGGPAPALADGNRTPFDDLDLPAARDDRPDLPARKGGFEDSDLPQPKTRSVIEEADEAFGDLDLPMPKSATPAGDPGFGDLDLPMPKSDADLPVARGDGGFGDLPAPADGFGDLDLPTPRSDLPAPRGDAFGDLDLPVAQDGGDLPQLRGESADLPVARDAADLPVARGHDDMHGDGSLRDPDGRQGVGGTGFGELDFGDGGQVDDMEFADIPQEGGAAPAEQAAPGDDLPPPRVVAQKKKQKATGGAPKKSRAVGIAAVVLLLLVAGGAALGLTPYGIFGVYFFDQFLPGAGDPAQVRAAIDRAEEQASSDRWVDVRQSLVMLGEARRDAGLNRALLARSLMHLSLYQARFEDDFGSSARASAIRTRLDERGAEGPEYALARAADALARGEMGPATSALAQARNHDASDPYVDLVGGELALAQGDLDAASEAFARAAENGAGARGLWGVARARLRGDDADAAQAAVDAVIEASPQHGEALVERAATRIAADQIDEGLTLARQVAGDEPMGETRLRAAPAARARAWTLVGRVHERGGRVTQALSAYDAALGADDSHVPALLGAGRVLLGDRPADALARFESVLQAEGADALTVASGRTAAQEAQLGAARAMLILDRVQEARAALEQLARALPEDAEVLLWLGKAEQAREPPSYEAAEQHYRAAIQHAPESFAAYLALAELFLATERGTDAGAVLDQAASRVPETAEMRYQLGDFELRRNQPPEAIEQLRRALELDAELPPALFSLGVAYRRSGRLDEAASTFDRLAASGPGHPGLSLERGRLYEARGESERAVAAYQQALEQQPDDMDLLLRLGAAQVSAEQIDEAEATLDRVRQARPNSPEAHHFFGRVAFARGRYAEALSHFRQAVQLDPTRGEYHLHVGWAALENGQLGEALRGVDDAIERDPSLGDAYWIRGVVKLRSGRPADALEDLTRARQLKPSRYAVHAAMGEAYDQLSRLNDAIASYERAVEHVDDNGEWWYRLGRLRMDRGNRAEALTALARATLLGDAMTPLPGWLADAHRLQGDALRLGGQRAEAVIHYRRYLELAPASAIDRREVRSTLMDLGEVPPGE